ncbi:hypothetical protein [Metabacillus sp. FJAT-53654]|uniref:Uncharacterized protein n=1 Tax=Metabacillus rhizosphaerae TaxID=3117747 RepID=A0ABZ2MUR1_9BACI
MAKSKARKVREKQVREGKLDVTIRRNDWGGFNPYNRQTKTKKEALTHMQGKHRKNHSQINYDENGSFICRPSRGDSSMNSYPSSITLSTY